MKWKLVLFSLFIGSIYWACEQDITTVGTGIMPDQDKIKVYTDTVYLDAATVRLDSIYAKSVNGLLGEFYDPLYGNLKSDYICQFYPHQTDFFTDSIINNKIDSVTLSILYYNFTGDSVAPMEATVYPVVKKLDENYYSNFNPATYCDLSKVYGKQPYTVRNYNVSDSLYGADVYRVISIKMPTELGQKLYDEWRKPSPNAYSSVDAFIKFFPGVYVTTTFGTGSIINVDYTYLNFYYDAFLTGTDVNGNDSTYTAVRSDYLDVTKEVVQLNNYKSSHDDQLLIPNNERTFIKTPAGIFTKVVIPIPEIVQKMGNKKFTNAKFTMYALGQEETQYPLPIPGYLKTSNTSYNYKVLLINPDSVKTFFENRQVADNKTSFSTTFNSSSYTYNFGNISAAIQNAITVAPDKNLELLVIPVRTELASSSSSYYDYMTSHFLQPSAISLKKGKEYLQLELVATDTNN